MVRKGAQKATLGFARARSLLEGTAANGLLASGGLIGLAVNMLHVAPEHESGMENLLRRCLAIEVAKLGPEHTQVAGTLYFLAKCVYLGGRLHEAEMLLKRCLEIRQAKLGPEAVEFSTTLHALGMCIRKSGRPDEGGEGHFRRSLAIVDVKLGSQDERVAPHLSQLALWLQEERRLDEAEELWKPCLSIEEMSKGPEGRQIV